jgi:hypothetical protein
MERVDGAGAVVPVGPLGRQRDGDHPACAGDQLADAVARLARKRTPAETCVGLLKKYGDKAAQARGAIAYGEAKADYDEVIAGLVVTGHAGGAAPPPTAAMIPRMPCSRS